MLRPFSICFSSFNLILVSLFSHLFLCPFKFCFQFNREGTHKTLDKELVVGLLQLVLKDTNRVARDRLDSFCKFLEDSGDTYERITLDQWLSFWDFSVSPECDDLSAYDEDTSAWPVLIDEYVEYTKKEEQGKNGKK